MSVSVVLWVVVESCKTHHTAAVHVTSPGAGVLLRVGVKDCRAGVAAAAAPDGASSARRVGPLHLPLQSDGVPVMIAAGIAPPPLRPRGDGPSNRRGAAGMVRWLTVGEGRVKHP